MENRPIFRLVNSLTENFTVFNSFEIRRALYYRHWCLIYSPEFALIIYIVDIGLDSVAIFLFSRNG